MHFWAITGAFMAFSELLLVIYPKAVSRIMIYPKVNFEPSKDEFVSLLFNKILKQIRLKIRENLEHKLKIY